MDVHDALDRVIQSLELPGTLIQSDALASTIDSELLSEVLVELQGIHLYLNIMFTTFLVFVSVACIAVICCLIHQVAMTFISV